MQVPVSVFKYDIEGMFKKYCPPEKLDTFVSKGVAVMDVKQFDENLYKGILIRIPEDSNLNLFNVVYFRIEDVSYKFNNKTLPEFEYDIMLLSITRLFTDHVKANHLLNNLTLLKLQKLTNIVFDLAVIDLNLLYESFATNLNKKTKEHRLRQILLDLNNMALSDNIDLPPLVYSLSIIYIKIMIKKRLKEKVVKISNEDVVKMLNLIEEYNSTKRSYKPIESFKERLLEENIPVTFFKQLIELQGTLRGRFNQMIKLKSN